MRRKQLIFAAAVIIASGCASNSPSQPAPVEDRMTEIPVEPIVSAERLEIATENASSTATVDAPAAAATQSVPALALLEQAQVQAHAGDRARAAATLERAIRIEPANPWPWHRLAALRLEQGMLRQAIDVAQKSNSLAADNTRLLAANWELIARARDGLGDVAGAAAARREQTRYQRLNAD